MICRTASLTPFHDIWQRTCVDEEEIKLFVPENESMLPQKIEEHFKLDSIGNYSHLDELHGHYTVNYTINVK